jgi:RHS repeat-associated protein
LTYQAQYEGFGKQVATNGSTLDRQKSNSKDTDPSGLVDEGFRYRDLETGMFINRDPTGFVDGPNLYTYVKQNPWTSFDPEGLQDERVVGTEEDDILESGAGLRNNDPELDSEGKPIFGSEEYEKENPPPTSTAPTSGKPLLPGFRMTPYGFEPDPTLKTGNEDAAKETEAEKSKTPGPETQKQQTDDNKEKTGDSTTPTPTKPASNSTTPESSPEENNSTTSSSSTKEDRDAKQNWENEGGSTARTQGRNPSRAQRAAALQRSKGNCAYCNQPLANGSGQPNSPEVDHVEAWSRGGETEDSNLVGACRTCNRSKGSKELGTEWIPPNQR